MTFHFDPTKRTFPACSQQPCVYSATPRFNYCKKHAKDMNEWEESDWRKYHNSEENRCYFERCLLPMPVDILRHQHIFL